MGNSAQAVLEGWAFSQKDVFKMALFTNVISEFYGEQRNKISEISVISLNLKA